MVPQLFIDLLYDLFPEVKWADDSSKKGDKKTPTSSYSNYWTECILSPK